MRWGDAFGREAISAWPVQAGKVSVSRPSGADGARQVGLGLDEGEQLKLGSIYLLVRVWARGLGVDVGSCTAAVVGCNEGVGWELR